MVQSRSWKGEVVPVVNAHKDKWSGEGSLGKRFLVLETVDFDDSLDGKQRSPPRTPLDFHLYVEQ